MLSRHYRKVSPPWGHTTWNFVGDVAFWDGYYKPKMEQEAAETIDLEVELKISWLKVTSDALETQVKEEGSRYVDKDKRCTLHVEATRIYYTE